MSLPDRITQVAFSVYENKGVFALLLGSGISRSANIPTGWEITLDLVRRVGLAHGADEQADWARWYHDRFSKEPNYSELLAELAATPEERRAILNNYIEPTAEDRELGNKLPTAAHKSIAELVRDGFIRVIITTNFDRLLENALREVGVEPTIVASEDALRGAEPLTHTQCYILKLHGDYKDARIRNTDEELGSYPEVMNTLLDRILDDHGLIVCGWSAEWDHELRRAILRCPGRRYTTYWAARGSIGNGAQDLIAHRKAVTVDIADANSFFSSLKQRVDTLVQSRAQNPLSVALLVNTAKRFLAEPRYRIQLDDLVRREAEKLLSVTTPAEYPASAPLENEHFNAYVSRYEAASEALASLLGAMGRWGDGTEYRLATELIQGFYERLDEPAGGLTVFLNLRTYPAFLIFNAYALGLTQARRWRTLSNLFSHRVHDNQREPRRLVDVLFGNCWKGSDDQAFKRITGLEKRKTALSDRLHSVLERWSIWFLGFDPDFTKTFERYELIGALGYLGKTNAAELAQELKHPSGRRGVYMPVGRVGWDTAGRRQLVDELSDPALRAELLKSGLAENSDFIDLFAENFRRISSQTQFW